METRARFSVHHKYLPPWLCKTLGACVEKSHLWESDQDTPGVPACSRKHSVWLNYVQDPVLRAKLDRRQEAIAASQETPSRRMPLTPAFANNPHTSTLGERRGQIGWVGSCRWQWLEVWGAGVCRTEGPPQSSRVRRGGGQWHAHEGRGVG